MNNEISKDDNSGFENALHQFFELGIIVKFFNGIWETATGFFILFSNKETISKTFNFLASKELLEDPHDFFINFSLRFLENLSYNTQTFIALYILIHGFLNLFLAIQLYRDRLWAYLATISFMIIFLLYQIYRVILYYSPILTAITIFDALFIFLTWHEYNRKKRLRAV